MGDYPGWVEPRLWGPTTHLGSVQVYAVSCSRGVIEATRIWRFQRDMCDLR
jgi:hypothetical protein